MQKRPHEYIVFPLDVPSVKEAKEYVTLLKDHVGIFKVGLELFVSEGPEVLQAISSITSRGVFLDMKFHDIPATVVRALRAANKYGVEFVTVHSEGGASLMREAAKEAAPQTKILAVTVLTSVSPEDLAAAGIAPELMDTEKLVLHRAEAAAKAGCSGVICSGQEVKRIKECFGKDFIAITPGIRPLWSVVSKDDQARIVTPSDAVRDGADYIVVGRPIRDAQNPKAAANRIAEEIATVL